jgi:transcription-repair coupling factor (superfamily II helicase)
VRDKYRFCVVITSDEVKARQLRDDCAFFNKNSIYYPAKDFIFYSADVHGNQLTGERLLCIDKIIRAYENDEKLTVVTTIDGCADLLVPLQKYIDSTIQVKNGTVLDVEALERRLTQMSVHR